MKTFSDFISQIAVPVNGFCILKPEFLNWEDDFHSLLTNNGWKIIQENKGTLSESQARDLYCMHKDKDFYDDLCKYMSSGDCICCSCSKDCKDPVDDMKKIKDKARNAWGIDDMKNAMHSSDSLENVERESKICLS